MPATSRLEIHMKILALFVASTMMLGSATGHGQAADPVASNATPTNATPLKPAAKRITTITEIKADKVEDCKKLFAAVPAGVAEGFKSAGIRNMTCYLKEIGGKFFVITYCEYAGTDIKRDSARLAGQPVMKAWQQSLDALQPAVKSIPPDDVEEVFYTEGAADVVPTPEKYKRIGMITGLKPEKEAEYRTLHATTWPGVLKGIKDGNLRNFTIRLADIGGSLYLIGYLEYVGKDADADDAAGKALPVNKRWWKFTDACQQPLPAAAAKGGIWDGLDEIWHLD